MDPHFVYFSLSPSLCVALLTHPPYQLSPPPPSLSLSLSLSLSSLSLSLSLSLLSLLSLSPKVPLILLQKMDLLLKKTSPEDVRQHVLPTIIASLETTNTQLQVGVQWNPWIRDTFGTSSVLITCPLLSMGQNQVSFLERCPLFRGVTNVLVWAEPSVLYREVSFIQRCH